MDSRYPLSHFGCHSDICFQRTVVWLLLIWHHWDQRLSWFRSKLGLFLILCVFSLSKNIYHTACHAQLASVGYAWLFLLFASCFPFLKVTPSMRLLLKKLVHFLKPPLLKRTRKIGKGWYYFWPMATHQIQTDPWSSRPFEIVILS